MCGITGKISFNGEVNESTVQDMADRLVHRGPDDQGIYTDERVGLAHRRLSIIDLSEAGRQPMTNETGTIWLVFNGEIYNYLELRECLLANGHTFSSDSDSEVIIHLYEEEGIGCLEKMRGMFGFALYDSEKKRVYLARDRFGEKPLYFHQSAEGVWFASEIKALFADPLVPREADPAAADLFLWLTYIPAPLTGFKGIEKLPSGHFAEIDVERGSMKCQEYWQLQSTSNHSNLPLAMEDVCSMLEESVSGCLLADVPVGVFLSGGIDSTLIVALASRLKKEPIQTFSVRFEDEGVDESPYSRMAAKHFGTDHREFVAKADIVNVLPRLVYHYDVPFGDEAAVPLFHLSQMAREHVKVVLTGEGADEIFGGYNNRYRGHMLMSRYRAWSWPALRKWLNRLAQPGSSKPLSQPMISLLRAACEERRPTWWLYVVMINGERRQLAHSIYSDDFRGNLEDDTAEKIIEPRLSRSNSGGAVNEAMRVDFVTTLSDRLLLKTDIATMCHALEARCPFLHPGLAEYVLGLSDRMKVTWRENKLLLRKAFKDLIPKEILNRKKMGFRVPVEDWLANDLKEMARDILLDTQASQRGYFKPGAVEDLLLHQPVERARGRLLWRLLMLELWHRTFIDSPPSPPN